MYAISLSCFMLLRCILSYFPGKKRVQLQQDDRAGRLALCFRCFKYVYVIGYND